MKNLKALRDTSGGRMAKLRKLGGAGAGKGDIEEYRKAEKAGGEICRASGGSVMDEMGGGTKPPPMGKSGKSKGDKGSKGKGSTVNIMIATGMGGSGKGPGMDAGLPPPPGGPAGLPPPPPGGPPPGLAPKGPPGPPMPPMRARGGRVNKPKSEGDQGKVKPGKYRAK